MCTWMLETTWVCCFRLLACRASLTPVGISGAAGPADKVWAVAMHLARRYAGALVHDTAPIPNLARWPDVGIWASPVLTFLRTGGL